MSRISLVGRFLITRGVVCESRYPMRIQIRSYITLNAPELNRAEWAGWGSVRYCTAKRSKNVIGLELSGGAQWT